MKRRLLTAILLLAGALNARAAVPISFEAPLSPRLNLGGFNPAASMTPQGTGVPLALALYSPSLTAASTPPPNAIPLTGTKNAPPKAAIPVPLPAISHAALSAAMGPDGMWRAPKVIDSLREHGDKAAGLSGLTGENGAAALEKNFLSAASLGDGPDAPSAGDGAPAARPGADSRPLLERMLERVNLDHRGKADEKKALEDAFKRMLDTPTGRHYAEQFLAEGLTARVHFEDFPDSQLYLVDGRMKFYAAQAYTDWRPEGYAEIRLNRHFVDGDADYMRESLPSIIGHELLGHGLWYGRASKENLYLAFHYHELNETLARLVGWAIDHEQDGRIEEHGAWTYLHDPANYLTNLKMRLPYYAVTFSQQEMADPLATLRERRAAAVKEVARAQANLKSQKTWLPVLDHFSENHGVPASRFELLRKELSDLEAHYQNEVANAESIVREVSGLIERIEAEPDHASENYLKSASAHAFFARLSADAARMGAELKRMTDASAPLAARPPPARPAGQITWDELSQMYRDDVAADAKRAHKHWN